MLNHDNGDNTDSWTKARKKCAFRQDKWLWVSDKGETLFRFAILMKNQREFRFELAIIEIF